MLFATVHVTIIIIWYAPLFEHADYRFCAEKFRRFTLPVRSWLSFRGADDEICYLICWCLPGISIFLCLYRLVNKTASRTAIEQNDIHELSNFLGPNASHYKCSNSGWKQYRLHGDNASILDIHCMDMLVLTGCQHIGSHSIVLWPSFRNSESAINRIHKERSHITFISYLKTPNDKLQFNDIVW